MKKICFLMDSPFTNGGEQRVTTILANYLYKQHYDVNFLLTSSNNKIDYDIYGLNENIEIIFLKHRFIMIEKINKLILKVFNRFFRNSPFYSNCLLFQKFSYLLYNKEITKIINEKKFDYVIGVASDNFARLACIKEKIKHTKTIAWEHSCFDSYYNTKNWRFNNQDKFVKYMLNKIDYYICQTEDDKNNMKKKYDYLPIVINNPNTFFEKKSLSNLDNKCFLAVGRFDKVKQFDKLIEAFANFTKKNREWNLYIVGDGPLLEEYKSMVKKYNLENRVFLPGKTKSIQSYYLNSSVYVMTSSWEGWGMVVTEAMQHGLPIISFDIPSSREIFGKSNCGILVKKNDISSLSEAMYTIANNSELIKKYSKKCLIQVKKFDIDKIGKKWLEVLK